MNEASVSHQLARGDRHFLHAGNNPERANPAQAPAPLGANLRFDGFPAMCESVPVELKSTPSELLTLNGEITNESSRKAIMKVKFPAMEATIGQRTYYACVMKLAVIPKPHTRHRQIYS